MSQASPKFKPGDKVRLIKEYPSLTLGKIYEVVEFHEYNSGFHCVTVRQDNKLGTVGPYAFRFELVSRDKHSQLKRFIETGEGNAEEVIKLFRDT